MISATVLPAVIETARTGADSVFNYVERKAEVVPEGVRWQTLNDAGEPQYRGDLYSNGGIPLFLADYYRLTGNERALELGARRSFLSGCDCVSVRLLGCTLAFAGSSRGLVYAKPAADITQHELIDADTFFLGTLG